jgi:hypothetical protein
LKRLYKQLVTHMAQGSEQTFTGAGDPAVPEISLRVASMDGTTLHVTASQRGLVGDVKLTIAEALGVVAGLIELFVRRTEDALRDGARLDSVGVGEGSVLFMLQKLGSCLRCADFEL